MPATVLDDVLATVDLLSDPDSTKTYAAMAMIDTMTTAPTILGVDVLVDFIVYRIVEFS